MPRSELHVTLLTEKHVDTFPEELHKYGCSEHVLTEVYTHVKNRQKGVKFPGKCKAFRMLVFTSTYINF